MHCTVNYTIARPNLGCNGKCTPLSIEGNAIEIEFLLLPFKASECKANYKGSKLKTIELKRQS